MGVTEKKLRSLGGVARRKPIKLSDGNGLYAFVSNVGGVSWRYDFTALSGKRRTLTIGRWPAVSIHRARERRNEAEASLSGGVDPCDAKRERKRVAAVPSKPTFKAAALRWHEARERSWTPAYSKQVLTRLEADVFPCIGSKLFEQITRDDLHGVLEAVETRGVGETVRKLRQYVGAIYRFAGARDDSIDDPTPFLRVGRKEAPDVVHHAMLPTDGVGEFAARVDEYDGEPETRLALRLTLLTAVRTSETLGAVWSEFSDWQKIPRSRERFGTFRVSG